VIIPFYNDHEAIKKCLAALATQTLPQDRYEVIVIDNGSSPPLAGSIIPLPFTRFLSQPKPGSYSARNMGVDASRGDILAFTDADCIPDTDWLRTAHEFLLHQKDVDAIGGSVQLVRSSQRSLVEDYELCLGFPQEHSINEVGYSVTANLIVRKRSFDSVGPFDEQLFSGGDREWGLRAKELGLRMQYLPGLIIRHPARASLASLISKHRRIAGGQIQESRKKDTWHTHLLKALTPSFPFRRSYRLLAQNKKEQLAFMRRVQVITLMALISMCCMLEKWRLLVGGRPIRK
jgi:GT2 family glycosyltransferase